MKKVILIIAGVTISAYAQAAAYSMAYVIERMPTEIIPFEAKKGTMFLANQNYALDTNSTIPDKLHGQDLKCTQYSHARENPYLGACLFRNFFSKA